MFAASLGELPQVGVVSEQPESARSRQRRELFRMLGSPDSRVQVSRLVVLLLMLAIVVGFLLFALLRSSPPTSGSYGVSPTSTTVPTTGYPTS